MRTCLGVWAGSALLAGVGLAAAVAPGPLVLRNEATVIEFSEPETGLALTALRSPQPALDVVAGGVPGNVLWRLTLRGPGYGAETEVGIDSTAPCRRETERSEREGVTELRLRWSGLGLPGEPEAVDVTATIRLPAGRELSEWQIAVTNRSGTRGLWGVDYPVLPNLRVSTGGELAVPLGWGTVLADPVRKGNYSAEYPSLFATLQVTALTDQGATLYVATHDPDGYVKQVNWRAHPEQERLEYCLHHYPEDMGKPGKAYASPFPTVIGFLPGDWLDAAKRYRQWVVTKAPWVPRVPLEHFQGSPRWLRENPLWLQSNGTGSPAPSDCLAQCLDLKQAAGGVAIAAQPYWWQVGWPGQTQFDEGYPDTFFALGRGAEERRVIKRVQDGGVRLVPYTNPNLVDVRTAYWKSGGWRWAALPAEQAGRKQDWLAELNAKAAKGPESVNVTLCPYAPERHDVVVAWSQRIVGDFGFDGVYLDQVGCINATLCFDPAHGHPLGGGRHWVDGYRRLLARVQTAIRALNPEAILTTESAAEPFGYFDAYLRCNEPQGWMSPLWPAVYGGLLTSYGSYLNPEDTLGGVPYAAKLAQLFTYGGQLGWVSAAEKTDPRPAWLGYLQELVQARVAAVRWLGMGEYLRPPKLRDPDLVTGRWKLFAAEYDVTWPAVLTAAFRAADGSVALVFTNYTDQPRQAVWAARIADLGLPAGRYALTALYPAGAAAVPAAEGPALQGTLSLPPLSVRVLEVTAAQ